VPGGWLYYEPAGIGPAVVLLHSGNFDSRTWDPQFLALAAAHRVIRYAPAALSIFAGQRPVCRRTTICWRSWTRYTSLAPHSWSVADALVAAAIYVVCAIVLVVCAIVLGMLQREEGVRLISSAVAAVLGGGVLRHVGRRVFGSTPSAHALTCRCS